MALPQLDVEFLARRNLPHEITDEAGMTCVVLNEWVLPGGFNRADADLLLRLQPGYPDLAPDMWWFAPEVLLSNGQRIKATEATERHLGRTWQRWSRHLQPGQWRSGVDGLESYIALIDSELTRCGLAAA